MKDVKIVMIKLNGHEIKPTMFPDGTSQVWEIPEEAFDLDENTVCWEFENEAELIHLAQLKTLLDETLEPSALIHLEMPYYPYGRQDKNVSNETTFARKTFEDILYHLNFDEIWTIDIHSKSKLASNISPENYINIALFETKPTVIVFPDKGAANRYSRMFHEMYRLISFEKQRNQLTGEITGLKPESTDFNESDRILVVDDICDRGGTFIGIAQELQKLGVTDINLYVTHGLFTGEPNALTNVGIKRVFTYKGEQFGK